MRMKKRLSSGQADIFDPQLDEISYHFQELIAVHMA
jgi:hypothetical protein